MKKLFPTLLLLSITHFSFTQVYKGSTTPPKEMKEVSLEDIEDEKSGGKKKKEEEKLRQKAKKEAEKQAERESKEEKRQLKRDRLQKRKAEKEKQPSEIHEGFSAKRIKEYKKGDVSFDQFVDTHLDELEGITFEFSAGEGKELGTAEEIFDLESRVIPKRRGQGKKKSVENLDFVAENIEYQELIQYAYRSSSDVDSTKSLVSLPAIEQQEELEDALHEKAMLLMEKGFYSYALQMFKKLHVTYEDNDHLNFWIGRSYMNGYNNNCRGLSYLNKAKINTTYRYKPEKGMSTGQSDVNITYYYATLLHQCGDLVEAEKHYDHFFEVADKRAYKDLYEQAQIQFSQLQNAQLAKKYRKNYPIKLIESNSVYRDFAPYVADDGNTLYFSSAREPDSSTAIINFKESRFFADIYETKKENGKWGEAKKVSINTPYDDIITGITKGRKNIYYLTDSLGGSKLSTSAYAFENFQKPITVLPNVNAHDWKNALTVSRDGRMIVFAAEMRDTYGGLDLYIMKKLSDNNWTKPKNMGPVINNAQDQTTPFFHPNGKGLFFSSNDSSSIGGFDIFKTTEEFADAWSKPENMGIPINSTGDDLYFSATKDGHYGYLCRKGDSGDLDIFEVDMWGRNYEEKVMNPSLDGYSFQELWVTNLATKQTRKFSASHKDTEFNVLVEPCMEYEIIYLENGKKKGQETVTAPCELYGKMPTLTVNTITKNRSHVNLVRNDVRLGKNTPSEISGDKKLKWQVLLDNKPYKLEAFRVNIKTQDNLVVRTENIDKNGFFKYERSDNEYDYVFEVQVKSFDVCERIRVVLKKGENQPPLLDFIYKPRCFVK